MSDTQKEAPELKPDVPPSTALVRTGEEAHKLAAKMGGEPPPNECRYSCISCGWDGTLSFDDDEIAALDGDIRNYSGPCPGFVKDKAGKDTGEKCGAMTLAPRETLAGKYASIDDRARHTRQAEYKEQAEVQAEVLVATVKHELGAAVAAAAGMPMPVGLPMTPPATPDRSDLPAADDASEILTPRKSED